MTRFPKGANRGTYWLFCPVLLGFLLVVAGCAIGGSDNPFVEGSNTDLYVLRVESQNSYDVEVYSVVSGRRTLLGTVQRNGLSYFEFEYPAGRILHVELETSFGDRYRVPSPPMQMGGRLELYVAGSLRRSVWGRR